MEYTALASDEAIAKTVEALEANGMHVAVVDTGPQALEMIKGMIPVGGSVMNGSSKTLEQIGFIDYLKQGTHGWNNLHEGVLAEPDKEKQTILRKQALLSDYYLGSVHALSQNGEFVIASNTGSQLPHVVYSSSNLIFVVSTQKIVPTLSDAMARLEQHVVPLENERIHALYGIDTMVSKILIFKKENPMMGRTVTLILVKELLGF